MRSELIYILIAWKENKLVNDTNKSLKKICFVTTVSLTLRAFVLDLAIYLHDTGEFDITFITSPDDEFRNLIPKYIHFLPVKMERGIDIGGLKAIYEISKILKREKFDLVQYSTPNASFYTSLAARFMRVPVRLYCQWGLAYVGFRGLKRIIFKSIEKIICRLSTWIEPDSQGNLQFCHKEKLYPKYIGSVIWNGSASGVNLVKFDINKKSMYRDTTRSQLGILNDEFVFGFVGRITGDKGINEFFAASQRMLAINNKTKIMLIGPIERSNSIDSKLLEWAEKSKNVIFCGFTNAVEQYLSATDCYVLPSYREGFGMAVIEAEAMGLPVIVTRIPGPVDAMIDGVTGITVEVRNVDDLFDAMNKMLQDNDLRDSYSKAGVEYVRTSFEQKTLFKMIYEDRVQLIEKAMNKNGSKKENSDSW